MESNSEIEGPFGRYRIEARIGRGAFGSVYRAHDLRLDRPVALKILSRAGVGDDLFRRFAREAELSRHLEHPHTVRVYDFGVEAGQPYIAFELLDGEPLDKRIRRTGPLSVEATRRIAICVLKSLMEAHARGIVHRDVKPGNVFLCNYAGEQDYVKVLDFGIAKADGYDLTLHGWLVGTPAYIAPEQIANHNLGPQADLYSLGLVMATLLSGAPAVTGSSVEILSRQLSDEPVELPPEVVDTALYPIVRRATEKNRSKRYATAAEMLADLENMTSLAPTLCGNPAPPSERASNAQYNYPSVAPVAYGTDESVAEPKPKQKPKPKPVPLAFWVAAIGVFVLSALVSSVVIGLASRSAPRAMNSSVARVDPSFTPALVRMGLERAGFSVVEERAVAPAMIDLGFTHPEMVGVVRIESPSSIVDAAWLEHEAHSDERRVVLRRGRYVLSVWAAPRGKVSFERATSERALSSILGS